MLFDRKTIRTLLCMNFFSNFSNCELYTFPKLKIKTLTANSFKNQTNDSSKLLDHNGNHQKEIGAKDIIALYCCGFKY